MLKWLKRVAAGGDRCDFCLRSVDLLKHVIAGREAMICDECAFTILVNMDNTGATATRVLQEIFVVRGAELDPSQRQELGRAFAILIGEGLPPYTVIDAFVRYKEPTVVHDLLDRTRRQLWRADDWINFSWAACEVGDFRSVAELADVFAQQVFDDADDKHLIRMNIIWARCHAEPAPPRAAVQGFVEELGVSRDHWATRKADVLFEALADKYLSSTQGILAKCWSLMGDLDAAMKCLELAQATSAGVQPLAWLLWGDLLAARGDEAAAKEKWNLAAASPNPGPHLTRELASRVPHSPYRGAR